MSRFLKDLNITSTVVLLLAGAITAFLWVPLLPLLVPLVTLAVGFRWISASLSAETQFGKKASSSELLYFPTTQHIPPNQAQPTAWSSSAVRPSPAGPGSLPYQRYETRNFKRRLRESRHIARVMNGLDLRKSASGHS